jgi:hypothetical protein
MDSAASDRAGIAMTCSTSQPGDLGALSPGIRLCRRVAQINVLRPLVILPLDLTLAVLSGPPADQRNRL